MQKKDNLIINSNKKVFNNVLGDLSRDQNQVVKFNKEKAYKLLDQVKTSLKEGFASKPTRSTKPAPKAVIVEADQFTNRMKKLAGLQS